MANSCDSVLHRVEVCCSVLQCVAACCSVLQRVAVCCSVLQCVARCCKVLQCVALCCNDNNPLEGRYRVAVCCKYVAMRKYVLQSAGIAWPRDIFVLQICRDALQQLQQLALYDTAVL